MKDRIRRLRKTLKLTQSEFGERIGLKPNTITGYESGIRVPSEAAIIAICREYNVNREWLEDGIGEMFVPGDEEDELVDRILSGTDRESRIAAALIRGIVKTPGGWEALANVVRMVNTELDKLDGES